METEQENSYVEISDSSSSSSSSYSKKKRQVRPFVMKVYEMVKDPETDSIVSWTSDGSRFIVLDVHRFSAEILPAYFQHNNFSSFVSQLHTYGFKKAEWGRTEYQHRWFRRGKESWLRRIKRRTIERLKHEHHHHHQVLSDEEISEEEENEIKEMLEEQNAMRTEIKQLQEERVALAKKLAEMKARKLFLLTAQEFLKTKESNNRKSESNNADSGMEWHTRLEELAKERADIMIGLDDLIE